MFTKIFIRTFPSTEECELFESILQTRWPELIGKADGVRSLHGETRKPLIFQPLFGSSPL